MKNIQSRETRALRSQLAQVLRRMRAMKRSGMPFDEVLRQLAAMKEQSGEALQYVKITLRNRDASGPQVLSFSVDKHHFRDAARHETVVS